MDKGNGNLIYLILGVVFVLAQLLRKRKVVQEKVPHAEPVVIHEEKEEEDPGAFWKKFLGVPEEIDPQPAIEVEKVPPVVKKPASFQWIDPGHDEPVHPVSSLTDIGDSVDADLSDPLKTAESEHEEVPFDLRSAVIQSVILERKYV